MIYETVNNFIDFQILNQVSVRGGEIYGDTSLELSRSKRYLVLLKD